MGKKRVIVKEFKLKRGLLVSGSWNMGQKIPQSGDMTHPFLYLSKSLSGDGKILISGCDKILC